MRSRLLLVYLMIRQSSMSFFFFFNDTATTEIYTLSLHDALPILVRFGFRSVPQRDVEAMPGESLRGDAVQCTSFVDRKSTRLNSSHSQISYAVFCLKKKKISKYHIRLV